MEPMLAAALLAFALVIAGMMLAGRNNDGS